MSASSDCRGFLEEIWSAWPDPAGVPAPARAHAESCPACRSELEALGGLSRKSSDAQGRSLNWERVLPASYWARLAAAARAALPGPEPDAAAVLVGAPALALAAILGLALWRGEPRAAPVPEEVLRRADFLERLELLERWEMLDSELPEGRAP